MSNPEISKSVPAPGEPCGACRAVRRLYVEEAGASFLEYLVVVGMIALASITAFTTYGESLNTGVTSVFDFVEAIDVTSTSSGIPSAIDNWPEDDDATDDDTTDDDATDDDATGDEQIPVDIEAPVLPGPGDPGDWGG